MVVGTQTQAPPRRTCGQVGEVLEARDDVLLAAAVDGGRPTPARDRDALGRGGLELAAQRQERGEAAQRRNDHAVRLACMQPLERLR